MTAAAATERRALIAAAFRLEWLTVGWLVIEAAVAFGAALPAHSLTLIAFGADSLVELASAGVLLWRLRIELKLGDRFPEIVERRAARAGSLLLFVLAVYVMAIAGWSLWTRTGQRFSPVGLAVAALAIPIMAGLANAKRRLAGRIGSAALRADAAESVACAYLAAVVVLGLVAQLLAGAWWIDSATALALVPFLVHEAMEAWNDVEG